MIANAITILRLGGVAPTPPPPPGPVVINSFWVDFSGKQTGTATNTTFKVDLSGKETFITNI